MGRPRIDRELRALIRRMSKENQLWGAPRIHAELLKLRFDVAQSTVAKHLIKRRGPPSQTWGAFLRNHAPDIAAIDLFVGRPLPSGCYMASPSFGSLDAISFWSASPRIPWRSGLLVN